MSITSVLLSIFWMVIIPVLAGSGIVAAGNTFGSFGNKEIGSGENRRFGKLNPEVFSKFMFSWLFGQLLLWCVFDVIAIYNILKIYPYEIIEKEFLIVSIVICAVSAIACAGIVIRGYVGNKAKKDNGRDQDAELMKNDTPERPWEYVIIAIVILGLIIQVVLQIVRAYEEVDDSFYVSVATTAIGNDRLYRQVPYSGIGDLFRARHGLAPFPIWLTVISRYSGMKVVSLAHVMVPSVFLLLTYGVYAVFGKILLGEKKRYLPVFMLFTELLVTFGFYSYMTPEKFFITRLREGKATLASLILPGIIMCLFMILQSLKEDKKTDFRLYLLLFLLNGAGCLSSTMAAFLCVVPIGICGIIAAIVFKKFRHLAPMVISCLPCVVLALMYLKLG